MPLKAAEVSRPRAGSLLALMNADLRVSDASHVCFLYDQDLPFAMRDVEYHAESGKLVFNGEHDEAVSFGVPASPEMRLPLEAADKVYFLRVQMTPRQKIKDSKTIPLLQKD